MPVENQAVVEIEMNLKQNQPESTGTLDTTLPADEPKDDGLENDDERR